MSFPTSVRLVEVGPRDGLQNEPNPVSTQTKLALIQRLVAAGLTHIEVASFVSPRWVPQMADAQAVIEGLTPHSGVTYSALTPNLKGLEAALAVGVKDVAVFTAASESFTQKNINCSIAESLQRFEPLMALAAQHQVRVRGYVSTVMGCPYEGDIDPNKVSDVCHTLHQMGCYEISLGDTVGTGSPLKAKKLLEAVTRQVPLDRLAAHFHDTYGQALTNLYAVLEEGLGVIDSSVAGLGGCPYAKGASGNLATEDVVYLLQGLGIEHGVDLTSLATTGEWISQCLDRRNYSKAGQALSATQS